VKIRPIWSPWSGVQLPTTCCQCQFDLFLLFSKAATAFSVRLLVKILPNGKFVVPRRKKTIVTDPYCIKQLQSEIAAGQRQILLPLECIF
jgi:hypothetical protein